MARKPPLCALIPHAVPVPARLVAAATPKGASSGQIRYARPWRRTVLSRRPATRHLLGHGLGHPIAQGVVERSAGVVQKPLGRAGQQGRQQFAQARLQRQFDASLEVGQHGFGDLSAQGLLVSGPAARRGESGVPRARTRIGRVLARRRGHGLRQRQSPGLRVRVAVQRAALGHQGQMFGITVRPEKPLLRVAVLRMYSPWASICM